MGYIKYLKGDATKPQSEDGQGIIAHVCNDVGGWGAGFVTAISKKWPQPESEYRKLSKNKRKVGNVQFIVVGPNLVVANMVGQNGLKFNEFGVPAVNYAAIEITMDKVCKMADSMGVDVHIPRIGCGLAGGDWELMEFILNRIVREYKCHIYVYDFDENDDIVAKLK